MTPIGRHAPPSAVSPLTDIRLFHDLTNHGDDVHAHDPRLVAFPRMDPSNRPAPFKRYPGLPTRPLPADFAAPDEASGKVLSARSAPGDGIVDDAALARLLFLAAGVTRVARPPGQEEPIWFRAAMSAGNLHPVELYVVCGDLPGVPAGVHHFAPEEFGLTMLRAGDLRPVLAAAAADASIASAAATIVVTGLPWRTGWKYGERGYRHLYWDAGALLAQLLGAADAGGVPASVLAGFVDAEVCRLLGVDGTSEFPLALAAMGRSQESAPATAPPGTVDPLVIEADPLAHRPITFPLVIGAQQAGALDSAAAVVEWRTSGRPAGEAGRAVTPPPPSATGRFDDVVLRRGSTRRMRREPVARELLDWGLAGAARPVPGDMASGDALVRHHVSVHAVDGVAPGAYRWHPGGLDVVRTGDVRDETQHLCLDQPLGGDSAFTVFHAADLDDVVDRLGARGYRVVQLTAGVAAGRLALAAFTLRAGASGITFFDDAVSRFFSTRDSPLLATVVGVPASRGRAGGRPRAPTVLSGLHRPRRR